MTMSYTPDGKQALFIGDVGQYGALDYPTEVGGEPISAALEIKSTTRGSVLARMTTAQAVAIAVPTAGMEVFNTDTQSIAVYTTSGWRDQVGPTGTQYMSGVLTAAQINDMYTTGISLIPAQGANTAIVVTGFLLELDSDTVVFTGGGAIGLQYGDAGHAGLAVSATIAATLLTGAGVDRMSFVSGTVTNAVTANYVNTPVAITNATGVFAAGGTSTVNWKIWYSIVPTA
jgi:hypothetical protein